MARFLFDGSNDAPKLRIYLNLNSLADLRADSIWPGLMGPARDERLLADGFDGLQLATDESCSGHLPYAGLDRINLPGDAETVAAKHAARGDECLTVHAGWGLETDYEVSRLVEAILIASDRHKLPIFIETHRATITQDVWRTVQIYKTVPGGPLQRRLQPLLLWAGACLRRLGDEACFYGANLLAGWLYSRTYREPRLHPGTD